MKRLISISIVWFFLFGCTPAIKIERYVDTNNNFISTRLPEKIISVDKKFKYAGSVKNEGTADNGASFTRNYFFFIDSDDNSKVNSGFIIKISKLSRGYWNSDIYKGYKNKIIEKNINIRDENYHNLIATAKNLQGNGLQEVGYISPVTSMVWGIGKNLGNNNDTQILIYYFEDIKNIDEHVYDDHSHVNWGNPDLFTDKHHEAINDFVVRAKESFSFLKENKKSNNINNNVNKTLNNNMPEGHDLFKLFKSSVNNSQFFIDSKNWNISDFPDSDGKIEFYFKFNKADMPGLIFTSTYEYSLDVEPEVLIFNFFPNLWRKNISNIVSYKKKINGIDVIYIEADIDFGATKSRTFFAISSDKTGGTAQVILSNPNLEDRYKEDINRFLYGLQRQ